MAQQRSSSTQTIAFRGREPRLPVISIPQGVLMWMSHRPGGVSMVSTVPNNPRPWTIAEMKTIIVTCYAYRMERIEQLLDLVDKPGEGRRYRLRSLKYVMATRLIRKVAELAKELQIVPVTIVPTGGRPSVQPGLPSQSPPGPAAQRTGRPVDERFEELHKIDEAVTIIPDKNTFSLIVHASRKHQDWIASLIEKLDKRRPQVLIDVTLVEITQTDAFNYDLNLITSVPDLTAWSSYRRISGRTQPEPRSTPSEHGPNSIRRQLAARDAILR